MTEHQADEIIAMMKEHWNMFMSESTKDMWRAFLEPHDPEIATKAVAKLAGYMKTEPKISDVKEVMTLLGDKPSSLPPAGTCSTCHGDRYVLVATREPRQSRRVRYSSSDMSEALSTCPRC